MSETLSPEDEFWAFALAIYARPGVAPCLLDWQDRRGANVNLALLCLWAAALGVRLDAAAFRRAEGACAGWRAAVLAPLRGLRRRLKVDWVGLAIDAATTRSAIQAAELEAERAEQALILTALAPWPAGDSALVKFGLANPGLANPGLAEENLIAYLGQDAAAEIAQLLANAG